jgi:RNA polymerase sigma-70 factor (ECF subfamily)
MSVSKMNSTIEQVEPRSANGTPYAERSDEELLLDYCNGENRRAFEELVHRYERELFNYLRHYLGDAEMAEDAFQATFLQVHLKCDQFEPGRKVRPWLYTVATNQAIDAQRRNRRHRMASLNRRAAGNGQDEDAGALEDLLGGHEPDPFNQIESAEEHRRVRQVVDELPESLREVLLLVYYQGLKYREAAEVLDIPVGTVKSRLHAAIRKLEEAITPTKLSEHDG